jgi:hypothetical protein
MKFTIRDLLWLTVVAALGVGWWLDRSRLDGKYRRVRDAYRELTQWVAGGEWLRFGSKSEMPKFVPDP